MESKLNYYEILGVERTATMEEIRKAYLQIARKHHPDSRTDEEVEALELADENLTQTRIFKIITVAYQTLRDPAMRRKYDQRLSPQAKGWEEASVDPLKEKFTRDAAHVEKRAFGRQLNSRPDGMSRDWQSKSPGKGNASILSKFLRLLGLG